MNTSKPMCPICGEGYLTNFVHKNDVEYNGQATQLDMHYSMCDACGSEQADAAQTRTNKRAMIAFRKQVDGLLTGTEVRALRERLGITQAEAADIFGGGPVAFSKYESDDVAQSEAMDKLLRLASGDASAFEKLRRGAGLGAHSLDEWFKGDIDQPTRKRPALRIVSSTKLAPAEMNWRKSA